MSRSITGTEPLTGKTLRDRPILRSVQAMLVLAVLYGALSVVSLRLGPEYLGPGYPVYLFPAAGIALGMVYVYGPWVVPGVAIGAVGAVVVFAGGWAQYSNGGWSSACLFTGGKMAQACVGAWLLHRVEAGRPLTLDSWRAVRRFTVAVMATCLVAASFAALAIRSRAPLPSEALAHAWFTWWIGDVVGCLILTPLVLAFAGRPVAYWRPLRLRFALPHIALLLTVVLLIQRVAAWEAERVKTNIAMRGEQFASQLRQQIIPVAQILQMAAWQTQASHDPAHALADARRFVDPDNALPIKGTGWLRTGPGGTRVEGLAPALAFELGPLRDVADGLHAVAGETALVLQMPAATPTAPAADTLALVAVLDAPALAQRARAGIPPGLLLCLMAGSHDLFGERHCETNDSRQALTHQRLLEPAALGWTALAIASTGYVSAQRDGTSAALTMAPLAGVFLVGMLLLVSSARALSSEALFEDMIHHAPFGVALFGTGRRFVRVNPAYCEMTGYRREELLRMGADQLTHPEDLPDDRARIDDVAGPAVREMRYVRRDGRIIRVREYNALRRDAAGEVDLALAVVHDITALAEVEQLRIEQQRAEAASRAKNDFLSRMSHELRTPLNAMLGFAQLLRSDVVRPLDPQQMSEVVMIEQGGWHLLAMIDDILDLSRIESGTVRLSLEPVALAPLIGDCIALVSAAAQSAGVLLAVAPDADNCVVKADMTRLKQVLINLLTNAIKYNRAGGHVTIRAERVGDDRVALTVYDDGLGMDATQLRSLFTPFARLGREFTQTPGTGIGLTITRHLIELMGADISVASQPGEFTRFTLMLLAARDAGTTSVPLAATTPAVADYAAARVIYIEDNQVNAILMQAILGRRPQIALQVFETAREGMAALMADPGAIDLLLLDLNLPDADGLDVLRAIRRDPRSAALAVVTVSADALPAQVQASFDAGATALLTKPVNVDNTLRLVDRLISERRRT